MQYIKTKQNKTKHSTKSTISVDGGGGKGSTMQPGASVKRLEIIGASVGEPLLC